MKHKINKTAAIFIVAIFALAGAATGYAMWNDTLTITGDVASGSVGWEFAETIALTDEYCPPPYLDDGNPSFEADWNCDPNYGFREYEGGIWQGWGPTQGPDANYPEPKNVACGELVYDLSVDDHTIGVIIHDAYPGYWNKVEVHAICTGTIPIKLQNAIISWDPEGTNVIATIDEIGVYDIHLNLDGEVDMELSWGHPMGGQLEIGDKAEISFEFCFLQPLPEGESYMFYITLTAVQWNEYTNGNPG